MSRVAFCPECESTEIGDRWCVGRKLQVYCRECGWHKAPRTPETIPVSRSRHLIVDEFYGWNYHVFDKYGHMMIDSATHNTKAKAIQEMEDDLKRGEKDADAGPYTAVLFFVPETVTIEGEMFVCKGGHVTKKEREYNAAQTK